MNNGAFGENFPYSNFHDLNMDWVIKIAKDFLDQYTHLQETISNGEESLTNLTTEGLEQLQEKADALETLLQQWYDTHSQDIANQLQSALLELGQYISESSAEFQQMIRATFDSFPADFSEVTNSVQQLNRNLYTELHPWKQGSIAYNTGGEIASTSNCITNKLTNISKIITPDEYPIAIFVYKDDSYLGVLFNGNIIYPVNEITPYLTHGTFDLSMFDDSYSFKLIRYGSNEYQWWNENSTIIQKRYESTINAETPEQNYLTNKFAIDSAIKILASNKPNDIIIPQESTGYNLYGGYRYSPTMLIPYANIGEKMVAVLVIETTNYTIGSSDVIAVLGPSGENYSGTKTVIYDVQKGNPAYDTSGHLYAFMIEFTVPNNTDEFWSISFQVKNNTPLTKPASINFIQGFFSPYKYTDFISKALVNAYDEETITVGSGKTYTSLRTALEYAATVASKKHRVTIEYYGMGNTYDVMNDITSDDLLTSSSFIGLTVPAYCKLKGMGSPEQNKIELTLPETTPNETMFRISTINLLENAEIENLWVYGKRCRYACHDDMMEPNPEWTLKTISNCRFTSDFTHEHRAYGAGYRSGVNWKFINCRFENLESTTYGNAAFSAHNNNAMQKSASITFINCSAHGGSAFNFSSLNRTDGQNYPNAIAIISFYGCKAVSDIWDRPIQAVIQSATAPLEVSINGFANNFDNNDVAVYYGGEYYNNRFPDQLNLWGKIN